MPVKTPLSRCCGFIADMAQCTGDSADVHHRIGCHHLSKIQFPSQNAFNIVLARYGIDLFRAGVFQDLRYAFYTLGAFAP